MPRRSEILLITDDKQIALGMGSGIHIDRHSLLPIDFGRFARPVEKQAPLTTLAPQVLLERCV